MMPPLESLWRADTPAARAPRGLSAIIGDSFAAGLLLWVLWTSTPRWFLGGILVVLLALQIVVTAAPFVWFRTPVRRS
jgi:hypothetical protein